VIESFRFNNKVCFLISYRKTPGWRLHWIIQTYTSNEVVCWWYKGLQQQHARWKTKSTLADGCNIECNNSFDHLCHYGSQYEYLYCFVVTIELWVQFSIAWGLKRKLLEWGIWGTPCIIWCHLQCLCFLTRSKLCFGRNAYPMKHILWLISEIQILIYLLMDVNTKPAKGWTLCSSLEIYVHFYLFILYWRMVSSVNGCPNHFSHHTHDPIF
jgi:hypothetical protein